jgi:N-acetylmuramoyl-L-alanine amidase
MKVIKELLPYNNSLPLRSLDSLRVVVIHCTELPTLAMAREYGEKIIYDDHTGNSGHYYIDRDGSVYQYIENDRIARHVRGKNQDSIGIELVNSGRYPNWYFAQSQKPTEAYADAQIESLKELLRELKRKYPQLKEIAPHSDLDTEMLPAEDDPSVQIHRKIDPGPLFPWEQIKTFWYSL